MIADFQTVFFFGTLAQFDDFADVLMPGNNRGMVINSLAEIGSAMQNLRVGGANTAATDFYYYLFFPGLRVRNVFIAEITFTMNNYSFHFSPSFNTTKSLYSNGNFNIDTEFGARVG